LFQAYADEFERTARTAFSMWNRDPASPSFGSFDRQYWGWKYKDFSDATLQYAVILAIAYAERRSEVSTLQVLLEGYVDFCRRIQHSNGSFDQCYPYERTPGVVYDMLPALGKVLRSPYLGADSRATLERVIDRAVQFALGTDETHGEVANHIAEYAWELLDYADWSGNRTAEHRGRRYLARLLDLFDAEEGWFREYHGADAGYQTRCLRYVVKIAGLTGDTGLWDVSKQAALFVGRLMQPNFSLSPVLGCRSTALLYPSAFEVLGGRDPDLASLRDRVRLAWSLGRVPLPSGIDFCNAIRLGHDALDAAVSSAAPDQTPTAAPAADTTQALRCDSAPRAGITVWRTPRWQVFVAQGLGGAYTAWMRDDNDAWRLVRENSGYLLKSTDQSVAWVTRMAGTAQLLSSSPDRLEMQVPFVRSLHDELDPGRMVLLRVLNLTVLRVQLLADLFRKIVVRHLMAGVDRIPVTLTRRFEFETCNLIITDQFHCASPTKKPYRLFDCRRMTGTHMASSRYFQDGELDSESSGWVRQVDWESACKSGIHTTIPLPSVCANEDRT
jgi:hypothetical protein